ncbi:chaplin family protein [Spirillospora sp. NPDC048832]
MRMWARNTSRTALVAAGAVAVGAAFGSGAAIADLNTSGNFGVLNGNQAVAPITAPVDVSGNSAGALLGASQARSEGGAKVSGARHAGAGDMHTSGDFSIGGGNQVFAPVTVPLSVCGNSLAIVGLSQAQCKGGASVSYGHRHGGGYRTAEPAQGARGGWDGGGWGGWHGPRHGSMKTSGDFSILGGNQVFAPITAPVSVCGNSAAVVGISQAQCKGGASVKGQSKPPKMHTSGNFSILGGNQVFAPITAPISVCGNSLAVVGVSQAQCKGGASVDNGGHHWTPPVKKPKHKKPHKPHHKPYKPSKHRPAAKHDKLPSTLRSAGNQRMAGPVPGSDGGLGPVKQLINSLRSALRGVDTAPDLPTGGVPLRDGSPVSR